MVEPMKPDDKKEIRSALLSRRRKMTRDSVLALSSVIQNKILESRLFTSSAVVMAYMPIQNEVGTGLLIKTAMDSGKTVLLPRVCSAVSMEAAPLGNVDQDVHTGSMGIIEPDPSIAAMDPHLIDLVLLPGVAFDRRGYRIGFGGGYYDRFIPSLRRDCILMAAAYDFQVLQHIPSEDYDQPADMIVTEKEIVISSNKGSFI